MIKSSIRVLEFLSTKNILQILHLTRDIFHSRVLTRAILNLIGFLHHPVLIDLVNKPIYMI